MCGVDYGVDLKRGYSQIRHRVSYTMFSIEFGLSFGLSKRGGVCCDSVL
jgi:hypothetical protein